ncbi:hypothetical protein D9736_23205 [Escherichia sp. E10V10]|uniref:inverse autotransporter beta domain-containing protein n=2 Tax=unclassified Escherichia TaxID=2608889 RepID=UPI00102916E7|nr:MULTISPECIES: inverse autotransporter beta domain-containing protein [unclassified Escherichia]RZN44214.1 hypothetical protein D9736_23205 [Escherichia sp. E10V10]TGB61976.1 hypothetical protein CQB02_23950 [Escherichia coli]RZM84275.1 hypothetical protein D9742_22760 [Escherichia sp. E1V33]RZN39028.1 hypothetical protein D9738_18520 [Escherichia sp. E10V5]TBR62150.1 hypothetical protein D9735_22830 [Escherichia sp. E1S7]
MYNTNKIISHGFVLKSITVVIGSICQVISPAMASADAALLAEQKATPYETQRDSSRTDTEAEDRDQENAQLTQLAAFASQAGGVLSGHTDSNMAKAMAKGFVLGKANQSAAEWLQHYGTAQIEINADDNLSLKDSSFILLHPWYDVPNNLLFSQSGVHRVDGRGIVNQGIGYRHFNQQTMYGLNTFIDYDLSGDHARAGIGAEYWRNFVKFSANGYIGLTGWKASPNVEDYEERPANGWDLRLEGYLPALPQLGTRLTYEQYFGREVALFGKENRQKNPRVLTVGVNFTPFPLLTLSAEHRTGESGKHDTQLKADVNWRIGTPLRQQLNTDAVEGIRTLNGSRYDLVNRNNDIVLEYRKQTVIKLHLPGRVTGKSKQVIPLLPDVQAKHGLKDIEWDDASFLAAGGKLIGQGAHWQMVLPEWKDGAINAWGISAIAHDTRGNASQPAEMQVVLTPPIISKKYSSLSIAVAHLLADTKTQTTLTIALLDNEKKPISGKAEQIILNGAFTPINSLVDGMALAKGTVTLKPQAPVLPQLGKLKESGNGIYTTTVTAGESAGKFTITASLEDTTLASADIIFTDTSAALEQSTLTADKTTFSVGSTEKSTLALTLQDSKGQPISNEKERITFFIADSTVDTSKYSFDTVQESNPGHYTTTFSGLLENPKLPVGVKINGKDTGKRLIFNLTTVSVATVTGVPVVGNTLTATMPCSTDCNALTYQWQREDQAGSNNYVDIPGATAMTYVPSTADQKRKVRVQIIK